MKKKLLFYSVFCIFSVSSLFANFDYQLDLISFDPLHKEYFADRVRPDTSISYLSYYEGFPDKVLQDGYINQVGEENKIMVWDFNKDITPADKMIEVKLGETMALGRNTITFDHWLSPIAFDFSFQAVIQSFYKGGFDDNFGYDGIYFYGGTFRIADVVSMRIGRHHYCSHYGDVIFKGVQNSTGPSFDDFWITYKYVRMDDVTISLSIEPTSWFRVYGELNYPPRDIKSVRPDMFAPNWVTRDGITINPDYPDWYNARIVNVGVEFNYPIFKELGNTTIGYDLHMYEEGKVSYEQVDGGDIEFIEDAPWELEHNVKIAQELDTAISVELAYHYGRSPFNNLYFQHTSYLAFGVRINPDYTVTLADTKKIKK